MARALSLLLLTLGLAAAGACSSAPVARSATPAAAPATATLAAADRVRIAEAFRLGEAIGDSIWPGWTSAPFAVLLVTPEREYLVRHPRPSADFTRIGYDSLLGSGRRTADRISARRLVAQRERERMVVRPDEAARSARCFGRQRAHRKARP